MEKHMSASRGIVKEVVNYNKTTEFYRYLDEVMTKDGMNLIMTHKVPARKRPLAPVILVHGLGQNRYSWTLSRRSLENYLVDNGFETFNVELRGHGLSRANGCEYPSHFETYLFEDMPALFKAIGDMTERKKMFYIGHSLGGTISYCIGAQFQESLAGIISIAGPYSMGRGNLSLRLLAKLGILLDRITPFRLLHPDTFYIDVVGFLAKYTLFLIDNRFNLTPLQLWWPGSIERDVLLERIEKGFDRTSLNVFWLLVQWTSSGTFHSSDGTMDFEDHIKDLKIPILFVVGDKDDVVPQASVDEAYEKAGSTDKTLKVFGSESSGLHWGHCDLICGRHAPRIVWPHLLKWMQERLA